MTQLLRVVFAAPLLAATLAPYAATAQTCWMEVKGKHYNLDHLCVRQVSGKLDSPLSSSPLVEFTGFAIKVTRSYQFGRLTGTITNKSTRPINIATISFQYEGQLMTAPIRLTLVPGESGNFRTGALVGRPSMSGEVTEFVGWLDGSGQTHVSNISSCRLLTPREEDKRCTYK